MPEPRAIIFDLDDTLYPRRAFVRSGFAAVAADLAGRTAASRDRLYRSLCRASRTAPGRELQYVCDRVGVSRREVPRLVGIIRRHTPRIALAGGAARLLATLRGSWRVGVLTNGVPAIQRRKVAALGLARRVDAVVYARECGTRKGKPDPAAFRAVLARLGIRPGRAVFVGDDPVADIAGARRAGLRAIQIRDTTLPALPRVAAKFLEERT